MGAYTFSNYHNERLWYKNQVEKPRSYNWHFDNDFGVVVKCRTVKRFTFKYRASRLRFIRKIKKRGCTIIKLFRNSQH